MFPRLLIGLQEVLVPPPYPDAESMRRVDDRAMAIAMIIVVLASISIRLLLVSVFPSKPISDFQGIVQLANGIATEATFSADSLGWSTFSAGTSTVLGIIQYVLGGEPERSARLSTAVMMGLLPLMPLLLLRRVVSAGTRLLIAMGIAFLPALIVFSGVVAQDNWAIPPLLGLACLALRNHRLNGTGYPLWSAVLWCFGGFFRQEMLIVALPLAVLAAWPIADKAKLWRCLVVFAVSSALLLSAIGLQREQATGHFAIGTRHGGQSILGSYVPGVGFGWTQSGAYLATLESDKQQRDWRTRAREEGYSLVVNEIARRPFFHFSRRLGAMVYTATGADRSLQHWALGAAAQRSELQGAASRLADASQLLLTLSLIVLHALFVASLPMAWLRRDPALITIALAVIAKLGIHFLVAAQARFVLTVVPLEIVMVAIAFGDLRTRREWIVCAVTLLVAFLALFGAWRALPAWAGWVASREWPQGTPYYRFELAGAGARAHCEMDHGLLTLDDASITLRSVTAEPKPNALLADLHCQIDLPTTASLEVGDRYPAGGRPGNIVQEVEVDGVLMLRHDVGAKAWKGWSRVDLPATNGRPIKFRVRVLAVNPARGASWGGTAATTEIRLVAATPSPP